MSDHIKLRQAALHEAVKFTEKGASTDQVVATANTFYNWYLAPVTTKLLVTLTVFDKNGKQIAKYKFHNEKEKFMTQLTDNDTASIAIATEDDHNFPTSDQLTWSQSDNGTIVSLVVSADTRSAVVTPVAPGTGAVVTVSDTNSPNLTPFTAEFDVTTSATSQIVGTVTINTGANTPPPAA